MERGIPSSGIDGWTLLTDAAIMARLKGAMEEEADDSGLRYLDIPYHERVFRDGLGREIHRCHTCGRASDCCCGKGCPYCVAGMPKRERG